VKRNRTVHNSGPYVVKSHSHKDGTVHLRVYPAFPRYGDEWAITRASGKGGGPGMFTSIALADELEAFLNQGYAPEAVTRWAALLDRVVNDPRIKAAWKRVMRMVEGYRGTIDEVRVAWPHDCRGSAEQAGGARSDGAAPRGGRVDAANNRAAGA